MLFVVIWCQNQHNRKHHHRKNVQQIQKHCSSYHQHQYHHQHYHHHHHQEQYQQLHVNENERKIETNKNHVQQLWNSPVSAYDDGRYGIDCDYSSNGDYQKNCEQYNNQQHFIQNNKKLSMEQHHQYQPQKNQQSQKSFKHRRRSSESYQIKMQSLVYFIVILLGFIRPSVSLPRDADSDQNRGELFLFNKFIFFNNLICH